MDQSRANSTSRIARGSPTAPTRNIVDTVISEDGLLTFAGAVKAAGLIDALAARGPFTVFAPTDEAFKRLPSGTYAALLKDAGKLGAVLKYHVVSGYFMVRDMKSGEVPTLQGTSLMTAVSLSGLLVNEARVTKADGVATNGIVHAIDAVILPRGWKLPAAAV